VAVSIRMGMIHLGSGTGFPGCFSVFAVAAISAAIRHSVIAMDASGDPSQFMSNAVAT